MLLLGISTAKKHMRVATTYRPCLLEKLVYFELRLPDDFAEEGGAVHVNHVARVAYLVSNRLAKVSLAISSLTVNQRTSRGIYATRKVALWAQHRHHDERSNLLENRLGEPGQPIQLDLVFPKGTSTPGISKSRARKCRACHPHVLAKGRQSSKTQSNSNKNLPSC